MFVDQGQESSPVTWRNPELGQQGNPDAAYVINAGRWSTLLSQCSTERARYHQRMIFSTTKLSIHRLYMLAYGSKRACYDRNFCSGVNLKLSIVVIYYYFQELRSLSRQDCVELYRTKGSGHYSPNLFKVRISNPIFRIFPDILNKREPTNYNNDRCRHPIFHLWGNDTHNYGLSFVSSWAWTHRGETRETSSSSSLSRSFINARLESSVVRCRPVRGIQRLSKCFWSRSLPKNRSQMSPYTLSNWQY